MIHQNKARLVFAELVHACFFIPEFCCNKVGN